MLKINYITILKVAIPLMASSFIQSIVLITDSSFLTRYNILDFDASGNGGLIYITLFMALIGLSDGAQILMARRIGQKKEHLLSRIFGTNILINLITAFILFVIINQFVPHFISLYSENELLAEKENIYLSARSIGLFFSGITLVIYAYLMAIGKTIFVFLAAIITAIVNIFFDWALIFGNFGFSEMGIAGAGYASSIAEFFALLFLIIVLIFSKSRKNHQLFKNISFNFNSMTEVLRIGSPIVLQGVVALATWTVFFIWIEQRGTHELTVSQNIRSLYFLAFVPVWGFNGATKTYISQYLGNKKHHLIPSIIRKIQILTVFFLFVFFHGAILYPEFLVKMINPNPIYLKQSSEILQFVTGSVFMYGLSSVYFQSIIGTGQTRHSFYIELISVLIYLISAYLLTCYFEVDLYWVWGVEYIYFASLGTLSYLYLKFYNWNKKEI